MAGRKRRKDLEKLTIFNTNARSRIWTAKKTLHQSHKIGETRKYRAMMRTWRALKQRGMQRNKEFGLFGMPSFMNFTGNPGKKIRIAAGNRDGQMHGHSAL